MSAGHKLLWNNFCTVHMCIYSSDDRAVVLAHQSTWQQKTLMRYGCDICVIDATHNTTSYGLPLFNVCAATLLWAGEKQTTLRRVCDLFPAGAPVGVHDTFCPTSQRHKLLLWNSFPRLDHFTVVICSFIMHYAQCIFAHLNVICGRHI